MAGELVTNPDAYLEIKPLLNSLREGSTMNVAKAYEVCLDQATQSNNPDLVASLTNGLEAAQKFVKMFSNLLDCGDQFEKIYGDYLRSQGHDV